ncbi:hypothetical protein E7Z53_08140 [Kocuria salina]|uniref:H-type lectin domain-containing protein n=1 Tax=Kocuria salina TaxID=1929416 RepID=UPI00159441DD|nr:H-type lectin domain-containing protein [Kocuria salina]NVC23411.1 hypothetical protein [Kocuria salina]
MVERRTLTPPPPVTTGADAAAALAVESSLKRLVRSALKTDTTPHGVKVADEGEGTAYALPDGSTLFLDGMKAAAWDAEIAGARQALEDARLVVEETQASLDATELRLTTMDQDIVEIRGGDIDVPGTLAAKVVQAMDVEAKRLVVTEDAILNQVTVIEGIVTPTLVANRINLGDLGHDLMQQAALTVAGPQGIVEVSGSGYKAWNAQNQLTVDLNGASNLITGNFKTAPSSTRVELTTRLASGSTNPQFGTSALDFFVGSEDAHGALWYDSGANRFLNLYAMPNAGFDGNTATGITLHNASDGIQLNGKLSNSRAIQKGHLSGGFIAAGGFISNATVTFPMPFTSVPRVFCQAQSENATDLLITLRSRTTTGFTYNVKNLGTNNSTGDFRFDWFAIA